MILSVAEGDPPLGQIVGGKLEGDAVAGQHADAVSPQAARQVRQNYAVVIQLHAEQTTGELLQHHSGYFYIVFLTHPNLSDSLNRRGADPPVPPASVAQA